jgi:hypothetical protein
MCSLVVAQAPSGLDEGFDQQGWQGLSVTVKLLVSFTGKEALEDVTITVSAPPPFTCDDETQVLSQVDGGGGTPRAVALTFRLASAQLPAHTSVIIGALYTAKGGEPRSVFTESESSNVCPHASWTSCCQATWPCEVVARACTVD